MPDDSDASDSEEDAPGGLQAAVGAWVGLDEPSLIQLPYHARCAAHTLSLCATSDVKKVLNAHAVLSAQHERVLAKCNTLWALTRLPKSSEVIQSLTGKCLPRPVATRWNSLYDCLRAILELRPLMPALMRGLELQTQFTSDDFTYIEEYLTCARPIAVALDKLQGEENAFYGTLLPTLYIVQKQLRALNQLPLSVCRPFAEGFLHSLQTRFEPIFNSASSAGDRAALAAVSHPYFKDIWMTCIPPSERAHVLLRLQEEIAARLSENSTPVPVPMEVDDYYNFGDELPAGSSSGPEPASQSAKTMMENYLRDPDTTLQMLERYKPIAALFREFNTQPPSSAEVERLFSYATMTNAPKANRLSDVKFEQRVLLRRSPFH